jgi:hypothetical protein
MCFNNLSVPFLDLYTYSDTSFSLKISHPLGEENGREGQEEIRERLEQATAWDWRFSEAGFGEICQMKRFFFKNCIALLD